MNTGSLTLEIVTPDGVAVLETALDVVVLRRRERVFEVGSEIAVYPRHGPLLVRIPVAPARWSRGEVTRHLALCGGFAEVRRDRVVVVTPRCAPVAATAPDPVGAAWLICESWRAEAADSREEIVGVPAA